ncbi:hypothetical protein WAJ27_18435, partial [Acinetobacter baumannii]
VQIPQFQYNLNKKLQFTIGLGGTPKRGVNWVLIKFKKINSPDYAFVQVMICKYIQQSCNTPYSEMLPAGNGLRRHLSLIISTCMNAYIWFLIQQTLLNINL